MLLKDKNLYYVGGVVRDEILNIPSFDIDYCFEGNAIDFAKKNKLNITKINPDFCTVRIKINDKDIDIASTRVETYEKKGHLPKIIKTGCPLKDDLIRRDFTINAMAKRTTDNELIDYYGGIEDIKNKKLRVLHKNSFIDDPTRIIRGLKFSIRFGFELSENTRILQEEYLNSINYDMSYHRIRKELVETFNLNSPQAYDKFIEQGVYKLLGKETKVPKINGQQIYDTLKGVQTNYKWLFYLSPFIFSGFNFDIISPQKPEKRIIEWVDKLKTQKTGNNTPIESIFIRRMLDNV